MAATHNIVLLGVQGAGKTTWLYRLVASFLEWRGVGRETLRVAESDEFVALAKAEGVNFDEVSERFLRRVHEDIKQHGSVQPTASNAATGHPTITLNFPSLGLEVTADDVPGELLMRAAHLSANAGSSDDPDGTLQNFVRQLETRLRNCDGVLFFHPPHQSEIEAESEMALRRFSEMALRVSKNKFLPIVVVFTKDDVWAGGRDTQAAAEHTRYLTQVAQGEAVMTRREHFCTVVWKTLQDYHQNDLSHAYWAPIAAIFGSGRNFAAISAARGTFAELRSPLDVVQRLDKEISQFFRRTFSRNMQIAFAALVLFSAITILSLLLIPYAAGVASTVPTFQTPRDVVVWIQDAKTRKLDLARRLNGLDGLKNALRVCEGQLNGQITQYTDKSFLVYRDYVARLQNFESEMPDPEIVAEIQLERGRITTKVAEWLDKAAAETGATSSEPGKLPDLWFDRAERYVNDLGPLLESPDRPQWVEWRNTWRAGQMARLEKALGRVEPTATYFKVAAGLLDNFWRHYVKVPGSLDTLQYLRMEQEDQRVVAVSQARQFARLADAGELEMTIRFQKMYSPNAPPAFVASALPNGLIGEVRSRTNAVLREVTMETNDGQEVPRTWLPRGNNDGEEPGVLRLNWRPDEPLTLVLVGRDNRSRAWVTVDLRQKSIDAGYAPPLPGLWPWFYSGSDGSHQTRLGSLAFTITVPEIPTLLQGGSS